MADINNQKTAVSDVIREKARRIRLLLLDVDGVLTEGSMVYTGEGNAIKLFNVKDGLGINLLITSGIPVVILTAQISTIVRKRAADLDIPDVFHGLPKENALPDILKKYDVTPEHICYIGDDVIDIATARQVGFSVAVADAVDDLKNIVDYITPQAGGKGAVRHIIELIMKEQGSWKF